MSQYMLKGHSLIGRRVRVNRLVGVITAVKIPSNHTQVSDVRVEFDSGLGSWVLLSDCEVLI